MTVEKCYSRINWLNKSVSLTTPLGATNLNKMDKAIETIDNEVVAISAELGSLDGTKVNEDQISNMIVDFAYDDKTGVMTLTRYDGTTLVIDTAIEKMAVNFLYDAEREQLIITLEDGTKQYVDMSALITQYEFDSTDTIALTVGENGHISASIRNGSITREMLSSDFLSAITTSESNAAASASQAKSSEENAAIDAKLSQSYAVGGSGVRDGEDTDNSKYYKEQAELSATQSSDLLEDIKKEHTDTLKDIEDAVSGKIADFKVDLETGHLLYTGGAFNFHVNNGHLNWEVTI